MPNFNCELSAQNTGKSCRNKRKDVAKIANDKKKRKNDEISSKFGSKSCNEDENEAENTENRIESSGKLSFYLDGRFVLELVHKSSENSRNGIWTQSKGTTWTPKAETDLKIANCESGRWKNVANSCISAIAVDETTKSQRFERFPGPGTVKPANINSIFTFRRRDRHKMSVDKVRKIARNPFVVDLTSICDSDQVKTAPKSKRLRKIEEISNKCRFLTGKSKNTSNVASQSVKRWFDGAESTDDGVPVRIKRENPLPEWYLDPSKAHVPVSEMIGYPRPYMPMINHANSMDKIERKNIFNDDEGPLDLRTSAVREERFSGTKIEDRKPEVGCCHENRKENRPFYLGLIPLAMHGEYSAPPPSSWPCVTCPVVAYAPTVVNSYYYCCCFLPGDRNCHCKRSAEGESIRKECPTDLSKMCNRKVPDDEPNSAFSGSMLKDLLLMKGKEEEEEEEN